MRVTFMAPASDDLASARLRMNIPAREVRKLGVELCPDGDIAVVAKHWFSPDVLAGFRRVIFDVCDDHFDTKKAEFYKQMCRRASAVTCNTDMMRFRIHQQAGVIATVIPDPYESEQKVPSWGNGLLWYGHSSNFEDLYRIAPKLGEYNAMILSNAKMDGVMEWSLKAQEECLALCAVVVIPTGKSPCKSANRLIEAVRAGKFVCAEPLPSYEEFAKWMWIGDIQRGVQWAHENQDEVLERVAGCQAYIADKYSPQAIGQKWLETLSIVHGPH